MDGYYVCRSPIFAKKLCRHELYLCLFKIAFILGQKYVISPRSAHVGAHLQELWQYRYLVARFALRDYKVRFAQTALGYLWAILQPLATLGVLYFVFGKMLAVKTESIPYFPFALSGLMYWSYFSLVTTQSAGGLIQSQPLIKKIYFPRLAIPFSKGLVGLVEFAVAFIILVSMALYGDYLSVNALLMAPLLLLWSTLAAMGAGLWISAISIRHRDVQQILPFVLQFLFFLTPVAFPTAKLSSLLPQGSHWITYLNPMMGLIDISRYFWFDISPGTWWPLSLGVALLLFASGLWAFQRIEKSMADLI